MTLTRTPPVVFTMAAATALALAGVAHADPKPLNGTYTAESSNQTATWSATSTCTGQRCTANISSSSGWHGTATLDDGRWHMTIDNPEGFVCTGYGRPDSKPFRATMVYSIDATTLTGTIGYQDHGECDTEPGWYQVPFTLTKTG